MKLLSYVPKPTLLQRYILGHYASVLGLCLFAATALFLVIDLFEKMRVFVREGVSAWIAAEYFLFKTPLIIHLMLPIAALIATVLSIGRLSQSSEITAMRACGTSVFWIARPILYLGLLLSVVMFVAGETIIPWAFERTEAIYEVDIRRRAESGGYNRDAFWHRSNNRFIEVGFYDARNSSLSQVTVMEFSPSFAPLRRIDAQQALWKGDAVGWVMNDVVERTFAPDGSMANSRFRYLPLVIPEQPVDFQNSKRPPESMNTRTLKGYISKLQSEGVPVATYLVELASKVSFSFVTFFVILIAFPFSLAPARSGSLTLSFIAAVSIGFSYYVVHAFSRSLGSAELLPPLASAWTANILLGCIGAYLMVGAEERA